MSANSQQAIGDERRQQILEFVNQFIRDNCYSPTLREIAAGTFIHKSTAKHHMQRLQESGQLVGKPFCGSTGGRAWTLPQFAEALRKVK
jgi:SOS-response transcriptional repressor LexA